MSTEKVLNSIIEIFKSGELPEVITIATFPRIEVPSNKWSLCNKIIMIYTGKTNDARGFGQWKSENRYVKKGSKAVHIYAPIKRKRKKKDKDDPDEYYLAGFRSQPVFRYEDTEGEEIYNKDIDMPELPLMDVAEKWGVPVKGANFTGSCFGYYDFKEIVLCTPHEKTFFHELSHVAHQKVLGTLKGGQIPTQEIVAELSAQALCRMYGKEIESTIGNSYEYIEHYANKLELPIDKACMKVLSEVDKVLKLIIGETNEQKSISNTL